MTIRFSSFIGSLAVLCSLLALPGAAFASPGEIYDHALAMRLSGRILLQVEARGEAWYVRPTDHKRYYMKDGDVAYQMMRSFSLGITDVDLAKIPQVLDTAAMNASSSACMSNALANQVKGQILLQVQQRGEAWYVDPMKCRAIYMKDGAAAYGIMRYLGLGILTADLQKIVLGEVEVPVVPPPIPPSFMTFGDGDYAVGVNLQPGTYRTRAASAGCYYERSSGFGGTYDEIIANEVTDVASIVTVLMTDIGFSTSGCGTWTSDLSRVTESQTAFGDGTFIIGTDILPGTYRSTGGNACYYARLSGFSDGWNEIIASAFTNDPSIVTIAADDAGFQSKGCGTWSQL